MYAIHNDKQQLELALEQTRGIYQENLILGYEAISGSTLKGTARLYKDRYKKSAQNLIARCRSVGVKIKEIQGKHNKRVLVIG